MRRIGRTMLASIRRRCVSCNVVLSLCMLAGTAGAVFAADVPAAPPPVVEAPPSWNFRFVPYGWLISLNGTQTVRGRSVKVDASFIDIVKESDTLVALMGDFEARNGPVALLANVVWVKIGVDRDNLRSRARRPV